MKRSFQLVMAHDDCTTTKPRTETLLSVIAYQNKQLHSAHCLEQTITSTGFSNSKDAMRAAY